MPSIADAAVDIAVVAPWVLGRLIRCFMSILDGFSCWFTELDAWY